MKEISDIVSNVSLADAEYLHRINRITDEEYVNFVLIKADLVKTASVKYNKVREMSKEKEEVRTRKAA